jgi:hypothetical protein
MEQTMRRPYVRRTRVGALLDCALRQHFLPEPCQEIRPVGLIMKDRLLVVAASGEVQGHAMIPAPSQARLAEILGSAWFGVE